ncbi:MAG: NAD(P)-dependent alcohol dehydrogenase [Gemmatimonadaceae bacterium]|nr:NAD(P)-dependent alcohol dehydrogenase [Gemmatimonadaceae bacterium]
MTTSRGFAAPQAKDALGPFTFERRAVGPTDIHIDIAFCGVCHSDIHQVHDEWGGGGIFPMVPGHEIVGTVTAVGNEVTKFAVGDLAGVGCFVDSGRTCRSCAEGLEQYCEKGMVATYNGRDKDGQPTYGGYSSDMVVDEAYALTIPKSLDLAGVAPLLCAGITTYSPLRHWKITTGQKVGVVGLGGLGHMALKFAKAFGAHVVQFTTSSGKIADAKRLGADEVVLSTDATAMAAHAGSFDFMLDTVSGEHDYMQYLNLLKRDGTMTLLGVPERPAMLHPFPLIMGRRSLAGSLIGGIAETQEMLDFCGTHNITADVEVIAMPEINAGYERMLKNDVKYRFVIDMKTLPA